jgi:serine/threonine-protein kinase
MAIPNQNTLLNNRYQLLELIGKGAMGRVYKAKDLRLGGAAVAVKFLAQTLLNERMRRRFWSEASICAQLGQKSIHIVRVSDYDLDPEDMPFYVMEFLQGRALNELLRDQPLPLPQFLPLIRQIGQGLQAAHQGIEVDGALCPIIHRDIKPSNILIMQDSSLGEFAKVLDFGISQLLQEGVGQTSTYMGTMVYSSPEQMEGGELDARSDIYSLGVMMYEMLTGELPIMAETQSFGSWLKAHLNQPPRPFESTQVGSTLPKPVQTLILSCLAKAPQDRPQNMATLLRALDPILERFAGSHRLSQRIGSFLNRQANEAEAALNDEPAVAPPPALPQPLDSKLEAIPRVTGSSLVADELLRTAIWPEREVPPAQVAFSKVLQIKDETIATLWVMLESYEEVRKIKLSKLYNLVYKNFLCTPTPYPLVLWITAFYNHLYHQDNGPRWMPSYLDLKTRQGVETARLLATTGEYQLLLFAQELPQKCAYVSTIRLSSALQSNLQEWVISSKGWQVAGSPQQSKRMAKQLLKEELAKSKPRITEELRNQAIRQFNAALIP